MISEPSSSLERFLDDFKTIVNIDSSSENLPGIEKVALFFQERFEAIGLNTELLYEGEQKVPCLQATTPGSKDRYDVMLLGHMDTVFPTGEAAKRPFAVRGDRVFGVGVSDMKGGLLVVLHALERLDQEGILDHLSLCVTFNGDEEVGSAASKNRIITNAGKSRRVLVFEPCRPGYRVVTRRKGGGWFKLTVLGTEAHAGADIHLGVNAVVELAHQIVAIDKLNAPGLGTSVQSTVISGGNKTNIIPNRATAAIDIRIQKKEEKKRIESFFGALPSNPVTKGARITVTGSIDRPPLEETAESRAMFKLLSDEAAEMGIDLKAIATGGCSDGNFTAAAGTPTIDGLGLVGANAHRPDEYVELNSILPMIQLLSQMYKRILTQ